MASKVEKDFLQLNKHLLKSGIDLKTLQNAVAKKPPNYTRPIFYTSLSVLCVLLCILYELNYVNLIVNLFLGIRCVVPNNYFMWEATRPISNCQFCLDVFEPITLANVTQEAFKQYAYISKPLVIKKVFLNWPAITAFDFNFFKNLYDRVDGSYRSVDEECQFLHFQSNFISLKDVFSMSEARVNNEKGQKPWYVGWGNCHPQILAEMRKFYPKPHFLPDDCEIPSKEYVFMGYDAGATMHLDFINRLMWQAQLRGRKTWRLKPAPECENICSSFSFQVEPGDAVLIDTRVWYHGTEVIPGEFSLAIQSEYS